MPVYDYTCPECDQRITLVRKLAERNEPVSCVKCNSTLERVVVYKAAVQADYPAYISPATGKLIEGRRAHIEDLKRSGCRVYEQGETQDFIKRKAQRQADYDRRVDEVVEAAAADIGLA